MATQILRSIRGSTIRVTRLDPCGDPLTDPCSTVVSRGFISVTLTGNQVAGRTYESRDIWGNLCVVDSDPDELRTTTVDIQLCNVDPDLLMVMTGRTPVLYDGQAIGISEGIGKNWSSYSLEVWTKALGSDCGTWGYFLVPYVRNGRLTGSHTIENGPLTVSTTGQAYPSYGWGLGPHGDDPFRVTFSDGDIYGMVITNVDPPTPVDFSLCQERLVDGAAFRIDACESETVSA